MKLNELTLEKIQEAYKSTGLVPGPSHAMESRFPPGAKVCPLQTIAQASGTSWNEVLDKMEDTWGFVNGFDNAGIGRYNGTPKAYRLGKSIAIALGVRKEADYQT